MTDYKFSIVEYYAKQQRNCGYCSSTDGSYLYRLHAHSLKVEDYQEMIDRGWRRCGKYCYKPILDSSCCPLYTIRCATEEFKLSKTQKKILKKFNNFLVNGVITKDKIHKNTEIMQSMDVPSAVANEKNQSNKDLSYEVSCVDSSADSIISSPQVAQAVGNINKQVESAQRNSQEQAGRNKCMKAKQLRIERKRQKLQKLGFNEEEINKKLVEKKKYPVVKTIEDYLKEPLSKKTHHNLKVKLVVVKSSEFKKSFNESAQLFAKYQRGVHKETENSDALTFQSVLVDSPLEADRGYGSYHQQYWLDDKLVAVGVIDILPKCVSSVYFFYNPEYAFLSLGTYGALREIEFTRKLSGRFPDLKYYYMGFYIHSCIKMKYKGSFRPSYLLCPEVYTWHPIQECLSKIETFKYTRLNEDPDARDVNSSISYSEVLILYNRTAMSLGYYLKKKKCDRKETEEIMEYAKLVGKTCAKSMLLVRRDE